MYSQLKKENPIAHCHSKTGGLQSEITYLKSAGMLFFKKYAKKYGLGLLNELLFIIIAQGAAKL